MNRNAACQTVLNTSFHYANDYIVEDVYARWFFSRMERVRSVHPTLGTGEVQCHRGAGRGSLGFIDSACCVGCLVLTQ